MFARRLAVAVAIVSIAAGCGGGDDDGAATGSSSTESPPSSVSDSAQSASSSTTIAPSTTGTTSEDPADTLTERQDDTDRVDWLTIASGVTLVSLEGGGGSSATASTAVRAIDGESAQIGFGADDDDPVVYTFELPAETTFDRFAVPDVVDTPGNTTFFGAIEIAGSSTSAADGFEPLVAEEFIELARGVDLVELIPATQVPVRWIRLTLSGALRIEPGDDAGKTVVRFSELIGNGSQETVPMAEGFDGLWELAFADNPDGSGEATELHQEGARVTGCIGFALVDGTVTGNVARLNGIDTRNERPSAYLLVVDSDGQLRGMESTNNGVFRARIGRIAPEDSPRDCTQTVPDPLACGSIVYVNFDLDSALIRPDSAQVIDDLFDGLSGLDGGQVLVEGHTSTEGATDYNLGLSERRAQAVVDALVAKGLPPEGIEAVGKGETEPLVSERDEASRAINRRVQIDCT